jgi:hypothetical protein
MADLDTATFAGCPLHCPCIGYRADGRAFEDFASRKSLAFTRSSRLQGIAPGVFTGGNFISVTLPSGLAQIDADAFQGCDSLRELSF